MVELARTDRLWPYEFAPDFNLHPLPIVFFCLFFWSVLGLLLPCLLIHPIETHRNSLSVTLGLTVPTRSFGATGNQRHLASHSFRAGHRAGLHNCLQKRGAHLRKAPSIVHSGLWPCRRQSNQPIGGKTSDSGPETPSLSSAALWIYFRRLPTWLVAKWSTWTGFF